MNAAPGTIRIGMIATGFFALTLALIVLQPGPRQTHEFVEEPRAVTRVDADLVALPAAPQKTPEHEETAVPTAAVAPPETPAPRPVAQVIRDVTEAAARASSGAETAQRAATPGPSAQPELREMSWSILESLNAQNGSRSAPGEPGSLLHTMVTRAMQDAPAEAPEVAQRMPQRAAASVVKPREYVVQRDDTLLVIAQRFYGDAAAYVRIFEANRDRLANPEDLRAGQVLVLPPR